MCIPAQMHLIRCTASPEQRWANKERDSSECIKPVCPFTLSNVVSCTAWKVVSLYSLHGDVIKWKHFPRYWPFVRGIRQSPQRPVTRSFDVFFDLRLNEQLGKHSWGRLFETPLRLSWRQCNGKVVSVWVECVCSVIIVTQNTNFEGVPLFSAPY